MADNVVANPGVGGATFATDDDGTAQHPYAKIEFGGDGTFTKVSTSDPLPVVQTGTPGLPTGASTAAKQPALGTAGTASTDVLSVQGIAAMTPLLVTASAGTNLNTSALALEAGGNLAAIAASNSVLDDWDETDRAKVNLIVGQAGIAAGTGTDGATVPRVTLATNVPLPAGTNAIGNVSCTGVTVVTTLTTLTGGGIAHDAADSGNPHKIGLKAESSLTGATMVADADRTDAYGDIDGVQIVKLNTPWGDLLAERQANTDGTSTGFTTFGALANCRNMITQITVHNAHATTNGFVDIRDGTAGAVFYTIPAPATGGAVLHFNPPLRQPTANTALAFDPSAAITTIYISVNGFRSKV